MVKRFKFTTVQVNAQLYGGLVFALAVISAIKHWEEAFFTCIGALATGAVTFAKQKDDNDNDNE